MANLEHLANLQCCKGDKNESLLTINAPIDMNSNRSRSYVTKCRICQELNYLEEAKLAIEKAIALDNKSHSTFRTASNLYRDLGNFASAIEFAKEAIGAADNTLLSKQNHIAHLANLQLATGDEELGLQTIESLIQMDPNKNVAYLIKSRIYLRLKRPDEAKLAIVKAFDLGSTGHSAYRVASEIYRELNELDTSVEFAKKAVAAGDNDVSSRNNHLKYLGSLTESSQFSQNLNQSSDTGSRLISILKRFFRL